MTLPTAKLAGCDHDVAQLPADSVWACPIGLCRCCGFAFPYIGHGLWTEGYEETVEPDPDLCTSCGGRPRVKRKGDRPESRVNDGSGWVTVPAGREDFFDPGTLKP